jgi:hypothetical protein
LTHSTAVDSTALFNPYDKVREIMAEGTRQRTIAKSKGKITDEMMLKVVSLKKVGVKTSTKKASGAGASKEDSKSQTSNSNSVVLDDNGNLHPNEDDCPFDIMCNVSI